MWYASSELDISEMAKLAETYYGKAEISNEEYLLWEYSKNPHGKMIGYVAREDSGNVVGQYLVIPKDVWCNAHLLKGSYAVNSLTDSAYNGQGIYTIIGKKTFEKCLEQGVLFTCGIPNLNSLYGIENKQKMVRVGELSFIIKPINLSVLLQTKIKSSLLIKVLALISAPVKLLFRRAKDNKNTIEIREVFNFQSDYEAFWEQYKTKHVVIVDRSPSLMEWRYFQIPTRKYRVFFAYEAGCVVGCMIIRVLTMKGIRAGLIIDFIIDNNNAGNELIKIAEDYFTKEKVALAGCLLNKKTFEASILRDMGYKICPRPLLPQPFPFFVKIHTEKQDEDIRRLLNWDNWFFTLGDYDVC